MAPRLSNAGWSACCARAEVRTRCDEAIGNRDEALALLVTAHGRHCLDRALAVVRRHSPEDVAAAHFIRGQRLRDPVEYLHALEAAQATLRQKPDSPAARFTRALIQEKLVLTKEAIQSWDDLLRQERSDWSEEGRGRRDRLLAAVDPSDVWSVEELQEAVRRRDRAQVTALVRRSPSLAARYFEESNLLDLEGSRIFADALFETGDSYARAVVEAAQHPRDRDALERGVLHFQKARMLYRAVEDPTEAYEQAAALLESAGNPLYLAARYQIAARKFSAGKESMPVLDAIAATASRKSYRDLAFRIQVVRANALEVQGRFVEALAVYKTAYALANTDPNAMSEVLGRRSVNYAIVGSPNLAFGDAFRALTLLSGVPDLNARHQAYGGAAKAAHKLGYPTIALQFQNTAVELIQRAVAAARGTTLKTANRHFAIALRERAAFQVDLGRDPDARVDLEQAIELAAAIDDPELSNLLRMRLEDVTGQLLLQTNPAEAVKRFDAAIALATEEDSTYRALLHSKRATARRRARDPRAADDIAMALKILGDEAARLLDKAPRGQFEQLWTPYFSRFQTLYHDMIQARIDANDKEGAFLYAEEARAFEPMELLLQSHEPPPGFQKLRTKEDLQQLSRLSPDTVILQYLVLEDKTYTWVIRDGKIQVVQQRARRKQIEGWVADIQAARDARQPEYFDGAMRAAYAELFRAPLAMVPSSGQLRIVIVPDGPMHALSFAALQGTKSEGYLLQRGSIAVAGSTSLYLYAVARDRQFSFDPKPAVLIVGEPRIAPHGNLGPLEKAREEAEQLGRDYRGAEVLLGEEATIANFLAPARTATIVHFAGHGVANVRSPWNSMLLLTPEGGDAGELTAENLMKAFSELERTRLFVLGACSTADGSSIGPEGVAPLVRPLIAANVPAVVGTLWNVEDATAQELLVSFHRHYRNGDDVAVALQKAQLEMLRNGKPAMSWAPFQVVGYAGSPYARPIALEETHSGNIHSQDSLHRPDGLHSQ